MAARADAQVQTTDAGALREPPKSTFQGRALRLALLLCPLVVATVMNVPICPSAAVLHQPCPGCGLTRATMALLHGDIAAATLMNPLALIVCPFYVLGFGYAGWSYLTRGKLDFPPWVGLAVVALGAALTVVWIARMFGAFGGPVAV
jgi:hypothetical protein